MYALEIDVFEDKVPLALVWLGTLLRIGAVDDRNAVHNAEQPGGRTLNNHK
jgi:hypothetical protein